MCKDQDQQQQRPLTLVDLPIELLTRIGRVLIDEPDGVLVIGDPDEEDGGFITAIENRTGPSLKSLSVTCWTLREVCLPLLFRSLQLRHDCERSTEDVSLSPLAVHVQAASLFVADDSLGSTVACLRQAHRFQNLLDLTLWVCPGAWGAPRAEHALNLDPSATNLEHFPLPPMLAQLRDTLSRLRSLHLSEMTNLAVVAGLVAAAPNLEVLCIGGTRAGPSFGDKHTKSRLPPLVDAITSRPRLRQLSLGITRPDLLDAMASRWRLAALPALTVLTIQLSHVGLTNLEGPEIQLIRALSSSLRNVKIGSLFPVHPDDVHPFEDSAPLLEGASFPHLEALGIENLLFALWAPSSSTFPCVRMVNLTDFFDDFRTSFDLDFASLCALAYPADPNIGTLSRDNAASLRSYCRSRNITLRSNCLPPPLPSVDDLDKLFALTKFVHARLESEEGQDVEEGMERLADKVEGLLRVVTELCGERWDV